MSRGAGMRLRHEAPLWSSVTKLHYVIRHHYEASSRGSVKRLPLQALSGSPVMSLRHKAPSRGSIKRLHLQASSGVYVMKPCHGTLAWGSVKTHLQEALNTCKYCLLYPCEILISDTSAPAPATLGDQLTCPCDNNSLVGGRLILADE
jgi:hypothetical protein